MIKVFANLVFDYNLDKLGIHPICGFSIRRYGYAVFSDSGFTAHLRSCVVTGADEI